MGAAKVWFVVGVLAALAGCGGDDDDGAGNGGGAGSSGTSGGSGSGGGGTGGGTGETPCDELANAFCDRIDACFSFGATLIYGDRAACVEAARGACDRSMSAPDSGLTGAIVTACADAYQASSCDDVLGSVGPSSCEASGARADGEACGSIWQCTSGRCVIPAGAACGVCGPRAGAGEPCAERADCEPGLTCAMGACVPPGGVGDACDGAHPCAVPNVCIRPGVEAGTCGTPAGPGESCSATESPCDITQGLFCHPETSLCQSISLAPVGSACGVISGMAVACIGGSRCVTAEGQLMGTCAAATPNGSACTEDEECRPGSSCIAGLCAIADPSTCG